MGTYLLICVLLVITRMSSGQVSHEGIERINFKDNDQDKISIILFYDDTISPLQPESDNNPTIDSVKILQDIQSSEEIIHDAKDVEYKSLLSCVKRFFNTKLIEKLYNRSNTPDFFTYQVVNQKIKNSSFYHDYSENKNSQKDIHFAATSLISAFFGIKILIKITEYFS